ncbi:PAS domain-containing protein [Methylobacterium sp. Leaf118]|uniref:PAS domain-containing protein n=1 Tax=Methylobacterium sp. Leaf118 TaxID=2876562 RepID=UPI001E48E5D9|nr:PAS domain-containing protein [Methylobacterium sp. Leaf118]
MMDVDFRFSSREFLRLLEDAALTGTWGWTFATREQVWSPGLFKLLGLDPAIVSPSYDLLTQRVHPDDRDRIESGSDIAIHGVLGDHTVRVLRPDGRQRILQTRGTVYHSPEGRPYAAAGVVLDVTDREQMATALRAERRRQWALFEALQSWTNSALYTNGQRTASPEILTLTGITQEMFRDHCDRIVAAPDRSRTRAEIQERIALGEAFEVSKQILLADGDSGEFRFLYTPVRDAEGRVETWATYAARVGRERAPVVDQARKGLEQAIQGRHVRAARALLGWSMQDLAKAGGFPSPRSGALRRPTARFAPAATASPSRPCGGRASASRSSRATGSPSS